MKSSHSKLYLLIVVFCALVYCGVIYSYGYHQEVDNYVYATAGRRLSDTTAVDSITLTINKDESVTNITIDNNLILEYQIVYPDASILPKSDIFKISREEFVALSDRINNSQLFESPAGTGAGPELDKIVFLLSLRRGAETKTISCPSICSDRVRMAVEQIESLFNFYLSK